MTDADKKAEFARISKEIEHLQHRADLVVDTFTSFQSSVVTLVFQGATDAVIEENRDKAVAYHEAFLDLQIHIGKLTRQLSSLSEK